MLPSQREGTERNYPDRTMPSSPFCKTDYFLKCKNDASKDNPPCDMVWETKTVSKKVLGGSPETMHAKFYVARLLIAERESNEVEGKFFEGGSCITKIANVPRKNDSN